MAADDFHERYPDEFEEAEMIGHGAIIGVMYGMGDVPPYMTENLKLAYRRAFAAVFDAGVKVGRDSR